jgi:phage repressor protein C with HTH and peptisase S24 domain
MPNKLPEVLKRQRASKGMAQQDVASAIGKSLRSYQYYEEGENMPRHETLVKLGKTLEFDLSEIYEDEEKLHVEQQKPSFLEQRRKKTQTHSAYMAPFIPVKAQAGYVKASDQQVFMNALEQYALPPGIVPHGASWAYWEIEGKSMEPVFQSGDIILASQVHPMDWENIRNFYVYVIVPHEGMPVIKRVMCKDKYEWVLISENENEFDQYAIRVEDIREVWVYRRTIKVDAAPTKTFEIKV